MQMKEQLDMIRSLVETARTEATSRGDGCPPDAPPEKVVLTKLTDGPLGHQIGSAAYRVSTRSLHYHDHRFGEGLQGSQASHSPLLCISEDNAISNWLRD